MYAAKEQKTSHSNCTANQIVCMEQVDLHCQAQGALLRDAWAAGSAMTNGLTQRLVSQHATATQQCACPG